MKIGIVLSGHLRSFRQTHESFLNLKRELEKQGTVDVFCHTWDIEESVTASWWKEHNGEISSLPKANEKELIDHYIPKAYQIEPTRIFDEIPLKIKSIIPTLGISSMLYSQFRAFQLLREYSKINNISYDLLVKTRYDIGYEIHPFFSTTITNAANADCLFIPNTNPYELTGACADVFALGNEKNMESYLRYFERFPEIIACYESAGFREFVPELSLKFYLDKIKIPVKEPEGIRVYIKRNSGDILKPCSDKYFECNEPQCFYKQTIEKNLSVLPLNSEIYCRTANKLITKYLRWLDSTLSNETIRSYQQFYFGEWIGIPLIKRLIYYSNRSKLLEKKVMKYFFEEALMSARYSLVKKILLAGILSGYANSGIYYFRVIIKMMTKK
jgi:hypothetical protein